MDKNELQPAFKDFLSTLEDAPDLTATRDKIERRLLTVWDRGIPIEALNRAYAYRASRSIPADMVDQVFAWGRLRGVGQSVCFSLFLETARRDGFLTDYGLQVGLRNQGAAMQTAIVVPVPMGPLNTSEIWVTIEPIEMMLPSLRDHAELQKVLTGDALQDDDAVVERMKQVYWNYVAREWQSGKRIG